MFGFILSVIVFSVLSISLAMIPPFIYCMLLEMAGLGIYVSALTYIITSLISLAIFIFFTIQESDTIDFIERIILIGLVIFAIFVPTHSICLDLIYSNVFFRICAVILIPLLIFNTINMFRMDSPGFISNIFLVILMPLFFGFMIASCTMFVADVWYKDISNSIQHSFIYDNRSFDEIRKSDDFKGEFKFLKDRYEKTYNNLDITCDINTPECLDQVSKNVLHDANITEYGYSVRRVAYNSPEIRYLCVLDKKNKNLSYYKINYKDFSFEQSSREEFEKIEKKKQ